MIKNKYKPPFIKLTVKEHWDELRDIPTGARGVYISLLLKTWDNGCEWIKDDDATPGVLKTPKRIYKAAIRYLKQLCMRSDEGFWEMPWLKDDYDKVIAQREANIENGKKGGLAKAKSYQPLSHRDSDRDKDLID
jgi:uncharacterized protein YdaU (DUF1376 family)